MDVGSVKLIVSGIAGFMCIAIGGWLSYRGTVGANKGAVEVPGIKVEWQFAGPGLAIVVLGIALGIVALQHPVTVDHRVTTTTTTVTTDNATISNAAPEKSTVAAPSPATAEVGNGDESVSRGAAKQRIGARQHPVTIEHQITTTTTVTTDNETMSNAAVAEGASNPM